MKKSNFIAAILIAASAITMAGCANQEREPAATRDATAELDNTPIVTEIERKDTPVRMGQPRQKRGMPVHHYTLECAIKEASLIVDVTITEWLGESLEFEITYFSVKVNNTIKGEEHDTFVFSQAGNSQVMSNENVLYKNGDRLLLFLNEFDDGGRWKRETGWTPDDDDKKYFLLVDFHQTFLDIKEHEGEIFILSDRRGGGISDCLKRAGSSNVSRASRDTRTAIEEEYFRSDPILEETRYSIDVAFVYDDVVKAILEISKQERKDTPVRGTEGKSIIRSTPGLLYFRSF
jgi:hypothetical protein